ncbi:MAG: class I SAM-dependent methyltransferase [Alphaproteobacteria bacterium]
MAALKDILIEQIQREGPISVEQYMRQCLYHPEYGYYKARNPLGAAGDFTTAPEISQMFGEMISIWLQDLWGRAGAPDSFSLIEIGPGQGTLMHDILRVASKDFMAAADIHLVDVNPVLIAAQREKLSHYNITWHEDVKSALQDKTTFVVCNELFDALPIQQYINQNGAWTERLIEVQNNQLCFQSDASEIREECADAIQLMQSLSDHLAEHSGAGLFIDYGYCANETGDTFQALKDHRFQDVLQDPGNCDLTAHVNFGALKKQAKTSGCVEFGLTTQRNFLIELGIETRADMLSMKANSAQASDIKSALKRLINVSEMGELFKVLAVTSPDLPIPSGFARCIPQNR